MSEKEAKLCQKTKTFEKQVRIGIIPQYAECNFIHYMNFTETAFYLRGFSSLFRFIDT